MLALLIALGVLFVLLVVLPRFGISPKRMVQGFLRDVREVLKPAIDWSVCRGRRAWLFVGPRITNAPTVAVILLDVYATQSPQLRATIEADWRFAAVILVLNLFARLSPRSAPQSIPGPNDPSLWPRPAQ